MKNVPSPLLNPIHQQHPLTLVSLNHFVVSMKKCNRVLGDVGGALLQGQAHPRTPITSLPPHQEQVILNM